MKYEWRKKHIMPNVVMPFMASMLMMGTSPASAADYQEALPAEELGQTDILPDELPLAWVYAQYLVAPSTIDNKVELFDLDGKDPTYIRGQIAASYFPNMLQGTARPELYISETFFSRGTRGDRTDVITVYDKRTLAPTGEIPLPGNKRGLLVTKPNAFQFTDKEKLGLVFNFTPAASVTVVDLVERKVVGDVEIPGCALIYPTGPRGFSSLCGNGTLLSIQVDKNGKLISEVESKPFNKLDDDPLYSKPAAIDQKNYFVSYLGHVQPIDLRGKKPKIGKKWSLLTPEEAKENWRPSAAYPVTADSRGHLYVLMSPDGFDGSHRDDGKEIWVFNIKKKKKVRTIKMTNGGQGMAITNEDTPRLLVATSSRKLDVYNPETGEALNSFNMPTWGPAILIPVKR